MNGCLRGACAAWLLWLAGVAQAQSQPSASSEEPPAGEQATAQQSIPSPAPVEASVESPAQDRLLDSVSVVGGVQPGPRLWRVRKGDHVLHVLATVSPLPSGMSWDADYVEGVIARSQEYLPAPNLSISANVGWISGLRLLPSYLRLKKNPDGKRLQDVLPAPLYARWRGARERYALRDNDVEKQRPMLAGQALYSAALKRSGLGGKPVVYPVLNASVKKHALKTTDSGIRIKIDDPKAAMRDISTGDFDDMQCLRQTLDSLDRELPIAVRRANAWATGDIATLRSLGNQATWQDDDCVSALSETAFARKRGIHDVPARLRSQWLAAAEAALKNNTSTFAVLPLELVVGRDNYVDALKARGYDVIEP